MAPHSSAPLHTVHDNNTQGPVPNANAMRFVLTEQLPLATDPDSLSSESVRNLRTTLIARHLQQGRRSLAICAPSKGSGCSFLAANLAMAMAQSGTNTLIIDANFRNPSLHEYIVPSEAVLGLSDCLRDRAVTRDSILHKIMPSLSVIYAGNAVSSTHEEIGGQAFKSFLHSCLRQFDLTILDTPPANRYSDARRIASQAHYALVVACRSRTYVKDVRTLVDELMDSGAVVVGTYLNDY